MLVALVDVFEASLAIVTALCKDDSADLLLDSMPLVSTHGIQRLVTFNDTDVPVPNIEAPLHDLIAKQCTKNPLATAVVDHNDKKTTYKQLDLKANCLANVLRSHNIGEGDKIVLMCNPDADMIIAIYSILKTGACYVPMDTKWPILRIKKCVADCGAKIILTNCEKNEANLESLQSESINIIFLQSVFKDMAKTKKFIDRQVSPSAPAYILYTSGSTGTPKGVVIQHASVVNLISHTNKLEALGPGCRKLLISSYTFDFSVEDIFGVLTSGVKIIF